MLQQTQVQTVVPYFERWLSRFPNVKTLASATIDDILKAWEGLGYYRRAHNLHQCARIVVNEYQGDFPKSSKDLQKLPGIGRYTAAAIASLCHGEDVLAVDGNIRRVGARLFVINGPVKDGDIRKALEQHLPAGKAGLFNETLMELGATLCTQRHPRCGECPISDL
ncbi:A/G-specific adenine glycosylase, partial [Acidobacteriota bacterium]